MSSYMGSKLGPTLYRYMHTSCSYWFSWVIKIVGLLFFIAVKGAKQRVTIMSNKLI